MVVRSPEELAKERLERIIRAIELKEPDRVPIGGLSGEIILSYGGITWYDLCFELTDKTKEAVVKFVRDFPSDFPPLISAPYGLEGFILALAFADFPDFSNSIRFLIGPVHDIIKDKWTRWPGRELGVNYHPQFLGGEFMKPEEYKNLIVNPVEFVHQKILPRACPGLGKPGTPQWNGAWIRVGMTLQRVSQFQMELLLEMSKLGYPVFPITSAYAPADIIGDFLRHPTGALLDIRRYPDDFKAACEALVDPILKVATAIPPTPPLSLFFIPLHLNEMLSPKLYNEFYWPYLKEVIVSLVSKGYKGFVFFEGDHTPHLDTILELPKGWGIAYFEKTDIRRAKEVLEGHSCVMGGIPVSLLVSGTPRKIEEYVKKLLEEVKPGGGIILAPDIGAGIPRETPVENIKALINAVEKYGRY